MALELVLRDGTRVPLVGRLTIGRVEDNSVCLDDPSVSRRHATIVVGARGEAVLADVGSSHGTWVDGHRVRAPVALRAGARLRLGDDELRVERARARDRPRGEQDRGDDGPGRTIVVDAGTLGGLDGRPALARGSTLKRRGAEEGARRWVLHGGGPEARWLALAGEDAALVRLLDGRRGVADLLAEADRVAGPGGPGRMVALLPELADRGLLAGGDAEAGEASDGWWRRLARPRRWAWRGADGWLAMVDARVGARLFSPPTLGFLGAVAAVGLLVFAWLVAGRYGTPFVVASKVGLGGLVFLVGRAGGVALHELAHGLAVVHLGRRVPSAGIKLVLGIPYAYVDTSEAWLESRRRRVAVSAAGPVCDLALGGTAALACLAAPPGALRDVLFQLAFGAYLGALLNLNPLADRDGYHILVDLLGEPALRRRAREHLVRRLRGEPSDGDARTLERYAVFQLAWMLGAATFAGVMALRYAHLLGGMVPKPLVWGGLVAVWLVLLTPAVLLVAVPLRQRRRAGGAGGAG